MRIRLDIAYDGTNFRGWAIQPGLRTVQGTLEGGIERILGGHARLVVAGRTDAGVHSTGQVAHVDLDDRQVARLLKTRTHAQPRDGDPVSIFAPRLAGVLGRYPDVVVRRTSTAPDGFDARFSATSRSYEYRLADRASGYDPMERYRTTMVRADLDVEAMDAAARSMIGLHDFAAYCKPRERATTVRTLLEFSWRRDESGVLVARVRADAFCHSMVRALVGGCVGVGDGRLSIDDMVQIRDRLDRVADIKVLAARGLTLTGVEYPSDELMGLRAEQTRARRVRSDANDPEASAAQ